MSITLGQLIIALQAETSAFAKGMGDAKTLAFNTSGEIVSSLGKIGDQLGKLKFGSEREWVKSGEIIGGVLAGIGVAAASATVVVAKQAADQAKEMSKLSQSYGLSITEVSQLRVASALTGVSLEQLSIGMGRMAKNAASGSEAFNTLGVKTTDGAGHLRPMNDLLLSVADRFSKLQDGTGKTALAMQLFGRSGAAMIPFLNEGAEGVQKLLTLSDQLGITWSEKDVQAALQLKEQMEVLDFRLEAFKLNVAKGIIPALNDLAGALTTTGVSGKTSGQMIGEFFGAGLRGIAEVLETTTSSLQKFIAISVALPRLLNPLLSGDARKALQNELANQLNDLQVARDKFLEALWAPPLTGKARPEKPSPSPTFGGAAAKNPDSGLAGLLDQARQAYNRFQGNQLETQISNIEHLRNELTAFAAAHPDTIFLDINEAVNKLNLTLHELAAQEKGVVDVLLQKGMREQIGAILGAPGNIATASGQVQSESQLIDLTKDANEQNRQRLEIYNQTRTPMEVYTAEVERLNILYADKSSDEYVRALSDASYRIRELYDPTVKYERELDRLNEARRAQLITDADYLRQLKLIQAQEAMEKTVTNPQGGLGAVKQGIGAGAAAAMTQWQSWSNSIANATIQTAQRMSTAMSDAFTEMIMDTKSVGQAFAEMGVAMIRAVVNAITQMIANWIVYGVVMKALSKIFNIDPQASAAQQIAANVAVAQSDAGLSAANTLALTSAMYPPPMPEILAGLTYGVGAMFASLTSMATGGLLPRDMVIQAHQGEAVLPRKLTDYLMNSANGNNRQLAFAGGGFSAPMNFTVNGAGDPATVAEKIASVTMARIRRVARSKGMR